MTVLGVDYSARPATTETARQLAAGGYRFACRYVSAPGRRKNLTKAEAEALSAAGVNVVVVFELTAQRALSGRGAGRDDGRAAAIQAEACGAPPDCWIYFAVDFDNNPLQYAQIDEYFRGIHETAGGHVVCGYGEHDAGRHLLDAGLVHAWWQSAAWSRGKRMPDAALFQRIQQVTVDGIAMDVDEALADHYGGWKIGAPLTPLEDVLLFAIAQEGDRYVFGTEVDPLHPDSDRWDCSELVQIACAQAHVEPTMPDGAYYQWRHCGDHGMSIPVDQAIRTRGALLFVGDGTGVGRDAITHVAWSLGNGLTVEARGAAWGVGSWAADHRFTFAALMPGVDYTARPLAVIGDQEALLMAAAKDDNDARRALVRQWCLEQWGGEPTVDEHNILSYSFGLNGADDTLAHIADHAHAQAFRQKRGW